MKVSVENDNTNFKIFLYRCTVDFDIHKVPSPTNALFIKLDKVLKFALKLSKPN